MIFSSALLENAVNQFAKLPGIGKKTALRLVLHLVKQDAGDVAQFSQAIAHMKDEIKFYPPKFKNTYKHWMENIRDWNISRQLWWGQQIPAYFYGDGEDDFVVAETLEEALDLAEAKATNRRRQSNPFDRERSPDGAR